MEALFSSNADRLEYLYLNLVGQVVHVRLIDGTCVEGIFVSRTDADADVEAGILLCCTRYMTSAVHNILDPSSTELKEDTIILYKDIVMVDVPNAKVRTVVPGRVDTFRGEFPLKKFDWAADGANELLESDSHQRGTWDQFETNEKRFGLTTTYKEEIYTTTLDRSKITDEQRAHADRVAREIETSATRGVAHRMEREELMKDDEGLDEGVLYSDVQRTAEPEKKRPFPNAGGRKAAEPMAAPAPASAAAASAAAAAAAAVPMDDAAVRGKRADDERAALQHGAHLKSPGFNPAAVPYTPQKAGVSMAPVMDFLSALADAISSNEHCYECLPDWPSSGTGSITYYDQDDSTYSQHQVYEQPSVPPTAPSNMYQNQQAMSIPHRTFQGGGAPSRMPIPSQHMGMNPMHHHAYQQQYQHHHQQQQPQQGYYGGGVQGVHNTPMQDYGSPKGGAPALPRTAMRLPKSGGSRVEPQQPVSTNPTATPVPVPTVDSTASTDTKHGPKLQRGRGPTTIQRNDDGGTGADTATANTGSKKRGGK